LFKIGWIGLGHMGMPMAKRLHIAGYDIKVYNRTLKKAALSGMHFVENLEELLKDRDVIVTMLFDADSVEEVYNEIFKYGNIQGKIFIDMTTGYPKTSKKIAEEVIKRGADFLEAPVIGSVQPAEKGQLTILVSGDEETVNKVYEIFSILGRKIYYMGEFGTASCMKLINNSVLGSFLATICEAVIFAEKSGIDRKTAVEILENGAGQSMVMSVKKNKILKEDYETQFSVDLINKDLNYAVNLSKDTIMPIPFTNLARDFYLSAKANNLGDKDFASVIEIFKKLAGI
jgi:3-hydroxyisobutyrate dehydrogenase